MGCSLYSGARYTQVNMVYLHITYKNCLSTLSEKKRENCAEIVTCCFQLFLSLCSFGFYEVYNLQKRKNPCFFMTIMKMADSSQATYVVTSVPKAVSVGKQ